MNSLVTSYFAPPRDRERDYHRCGEALDAFGVRPRCPQHQARPPPSRRSATAPRCSTTGRRDTMEPTQAQAGASSSVSVDQLARATLHLPQCLHRAATASLLPRAVRCHSSARSHHAATTTLPTVTATASCVALGGCTHPGASTLPSTPCPRLATTHGLPCSGRAAQPASRLLHRADRASASLRQPSEGQRTAPDALQRLGASHSTVPPPARAARSDLRHPRFSRGTVQRKIEVWCDGVMVLWWSRGALMTTHSLFKISYIRFRGVAYITPSHRAR